MKRRNTALNILGWSLFWSQTLAMVWYQITGATLGCALTDTATRLAWALAMALAVMAVDALATDGSGSLAPPVMRLAPSGDTPGVIMRAYLGRVQTPSNGRPSMQAVRQAVEILYGKPYQDTMRQSYGTSSPEDVEACAEEWCVARAALERSGRTDITLAWPTSLPVRSSAYDVVRRAPRYLLRPRAAN